MKSIEQVFNENPGLFAHGWAYRDSPVGLPINVQEVHSAAAFIRECCEQTPGTNRRQGSYGLKHDAEKWSGGYVSNGAFIAAAILEGYTVRRFPNSPNCSFNIRVRARVAVTNSAFGGDR